MNLIEIKWDGPYSYNDVMLKYDESDYGVYQIYGRHSVLNGDVLLNIGKAVNQCYAQRFKNPNKKWVDYAFHECRIYLGRLGGAQVCTEDEWNEQIGIAEQILIDYCQPPFNTQKSNMINKLANDILILNHGQRVLLPYSITTYWRNSAFAENTWKPYTTNMHK